MIKKKSGIFTILLVSVSLFSFCGIAKGEEAPLYRDEACGFEIGIPQGWRVLASAPCNVAIAQYPQKSPLINVTVRHPLSSPNIKTPLDLGTFIINTWKAQDPSIKIIKGPEEVIVNQLNGIRIMSESYVKDKGGDVPLMNHTYYFISEGKMIEIMAMDKKADFDRQLEKIEQSVRSFRLGSSKKENQKTDFDMESIEKECAKLKELIQIKIDFSPIEENRYAELKKRILDSEGEIHSYATLLLWKDKSQEKLASSEYTALKWLMLTVTPDKYQVWQANYIGGGMDVWRTIGNETYTHIVDWVAAPPEADVFMHWHKIHRFLSFSKFRNLLEHEIPLGVASLEWNKGHYTVLKFVPREDDDLLYFKDWSKNPSIQEITLWVTEGTSFIVTAKTRYQDDKGKNYEYEQYFSEFNKPFLIEKPN